jgi:hypothetical protein
MYIRGRSHSCFIQDTGRWDPLGRSVFPAGARRGPRRLARVFRGHHNHPSAIRADSRPNRDPLDAIRSHLTPHTLRPAPNPPRAASSRVKDRWCHPLCCYTSLGFRRIAHCVCQCMRKSVESKEGAKHRSTDGNRSPEYYPCRVSACIVAGSHHLLQHRYDTPIQLT